MNEAPSSRVPPHAASHVLGIRSVDCRFPLLATTCMLLVACQAPAPPPPERVGDYNRMERVVVPGIETVYRKQGADFSRYARVIVEPPTVAFRENWRPQDDPSLANVDLPDLATIRQHVSQAFLQALKTRLQEHSGYAVVDAPAPDVLQVKAELNDFYVSSSALKTAAGGDKPSYMESSEVTLVVELRDSTTGALLCRAYDHRASNEGGAILLSQGTWSSPALRNSMDYWASLLRRSLDQVKARK